MVLRHAYGRHAAPPLHPRRYHLLATEPLWSSLSLVLRPKFGLSPSRYPRMAYDAPERSSGLRPSYWVLTRENRRGINRRRFAEPVYDEPLKRWGA